MALMELTRDIYNVAPFLDSYQPLTEIPLAHCGTVWTDLASSQEYLLIVDQMLWFGTSLPHSLISPNQIHTYGIPVYDDPYYSPCGFGINSEQAFIPFNTMGTIIHFKSRVPSDWEKMHLPVILLTDVTWNLNEEVMQYKGWSKEESEMRTIRSLTSGINKRLVCSVSSPQTKMRSETDIALANISCVYDAKSLCNQLIAAVNITTTY